MLWEITLLKFSSPAWISQFICLRPGWLLCLMSWDVESLLHGQSGLFCIIASQCFPHVKWLNKHSSTNTGLSFSSVQRKWNIEMIQCTSMRKRRVLSPCQETSNHLLFLHYCQVLGGGENVFSVLTSVHLWRMRLIFIHHEFISSMAVKHMWHELWKLLWAGKSPWTCSVLTDKLQRDFKTLASLATPRLQTTHNATFPEGDTET